MTTVDYTQTNKEEDVKTKGLSNKMTKGLIALAAVGIGCGVYGFKLGYTTGAKDGIVYTSNEFLKATANISKAVMESKGE